MLDAPRWLLKPAPRPLIPLDAPLKALSLAPEPRDVWRLPTRSPPIPTSAAPRVAHAAVVEVSGAFAPVTGLAAP
jgi:hypothetical protein